MGVQYETYEDRHEALRRDWQVKRLSREEKLALIRDGKKEPAGNAFAGGERRPL